MSSNASIPNMSRKQGLDEFIADYAPPAAPSSKRSKTSETTPQVDLLGSTNDSRNMSAPHEHQLKAPGMDTRPLEALSQLNYRSMTAPVHDLGTAVANTQSQPPEGSSAGAPLEPVAPPPSEDPVAIQQARHRSMEGAPTASQSRRVSIVLSDRRYPLGIFDRKQYWNSIEERGSYLGRLRAHDLRIRDFIRHLSAHDVRTAGLSDDARYMACGLRYDCIMSKLNKQYPNVGLRVRAYSWNVLPSDEALLQQLEADTFLVLSESRAPGEEPMSLVKAKKEAMRTQERWFLFATSFVFDSVMNFLFQRTRRGLLMDHIDDREEGQAKYDMERELADAASRQWPPEYRENYFIILMATSIREMTISGLPATSSDLEILEACRQNVNSVRDSFWHDSLRSNPVEGMTLSQQLYVRIDGLLEVIEKDLKSEIDRMNDARDAAAAATAAQVARMVQAAKDAQAEHQAQRDGHGQTVHQQQQHLLWHVPASQVSTNDSQASQAPTPVTTPNSEPHVAHTSQQDGQTASWQESHNGNNGSRDGTALHGPPGSIPKLASNNAASQQPHTSADTCTGTSRPLGEMDANFVPMGPISTDVGPSRFTRASAPQLAPAIPKPSCIGKRKRTENPTADVDAERTPKKSRIDKGTSFSSSYGVAPVARQVQTAHMEAIAAGGTSERHSWVAPEAASFTESLNSEDPTYQAMANALLAFAAAGAAVGTNDISNGEDSVDNDRAQLDSNELPVGPGAETFVHEPVHQNQSAVHDANVSLQVASDRDSSPLLPNPPVTTIPGPVELQLPVGELHHLGNDEFCRVLEARCVEWLDFLSRC